jgi:hypothetical protein
MKKRKKSTPATLTENDKKSILKSAVGLSKGIGCSSPDTLAAGLEALQGLSQEELAEVFKTCIQQMPREDVQRLSENYDKMRRRGR